MRIPEKQLIAMLGVTRQRIHYWRGLGLLPEREQGSKQGYSFRDVLGIKIIKELTSYGLTPRKIAQSLKRLRLMLHKEDVLTGKSLFVSGKEIFVFQGGKAITPRTGQFLLFEYDELKASLGLALKQSVIRLGKLAESTPEPLDRIEPTVLITNHEASGQ